MKETIFLLGGQDLEMQVIIGILKKQSLSYRDRLLNWSNAYLSQYTEELEQYGNNSSYLIYGIELQEDVSPPSNYIRIDHHNDYIHQPSALEQIAAILHLPLTRYQQLIAANDKAYIPGMKAMGATLEEIALIRKEDRRAQGVTEGDELLAQKAITENKEIIGDLTIIHARTSRFSPICDRLYPYKRLLIYTDDELMYYGEGVKALTLLFSSDIANGDIFYGGGESGYLGTKKGLYTAQEIETLINKIKYIKLQ